MGFDPPGKSDLEDFDPGLVAAHNRVEKGIKVFGDRGVCIGQNRSGPGVSQRGMLRSRDQLVNPGVKIFYGDPGDPGLLRRDLGCLFLVPETRCTRDTLYKGFI